MYKSKSSLVTECYIMGDLRCWAIKTKKYLHIAGSSLTHANTAEQLRIFRDFTTLESYHRDSNGEFHRRNIQFSQESYLPGMFHYMFVIGPCSDLPR